jgi:hypothetical protein
MQKGSFLRREGCVVICTLPGNGPNQTMIDSCRRFSQVEWQGIEVSGLDWMPHWWKAYKKEYNCDGSVPIRGSGIMVWMSQGPTGNSTCKSPGIALIILF